PFAGDGSLEHSPLDADIVQAVQALAGTELSHLGPSKVAALLRFLVDEFLETDFVREALQQRADSSADTMQRLRGELADERAKLREVESEERELARKEREKKKAAAQEKAAAAAAARE
ncbi:hypothetical protein DUNSADRAFT_4771, partial [Dunaliella salina]